MTSNITGHYYFWKNLVVLEMFEIKLHIFAANQIVGCTNILLVRNYGKITISIMSNL